MEEEKEDKEEEEEVKETKAQGERHCGIRKLVALACAQMRVGSTHERFGAPSVAVETPQHINSSTVVVSKRTDTTRAMRAVAVAVAVASASGRRDVCAPKAPAPSDAGHLQLTTSQNPQRWP
jgi:hypothetical protein